jgi:hypothetical protein
VAGSLTGALQQALAVLFAMAGAACYAVASVVQQGSAALLPSTKAFDPAVLVRLARKRRWLLGLIAIGGGFGLQAAALDLGRLVVVEPVFPAGLLFALLLAARVEGRRLRHSEWTAAVATVAGLAAFLVAAEPSGGSRTAGGGLLGLAAVGAACVAGVCCLLAFRVTAHHRALALSIGGGIGAGVTDAVTKTVAAVAGVHKLGVLGDVRLYLLAGVGLMTFTMQQNGYRAAGLPASLPAFAVLEPLVGAMLGLFIYHEHLGGGSVRIAVEVVAVLAAVWGIARLAKSVIEVAARLAASAAPVQAVQAVQADPAA